jgi:hypothetical protein
MKWAVDWRDPIEKTGRQDIFLAFGVLSDPRSLVGKKVTSVKWDDDGKLIFETED